MGAHNSAGETMAAICIVPNIAGRAIDSNVAYIALVAKRARKSYSTDRTVGGSGALEALSVD